MARRISSSVTRAVFTAASAPSTSDATLNDSTIPSAPSISVAAVPAIAGKTPAWTFGITNVSITIPVPATVPASTLERTAATSPPIITMYFPEQMLRERRRETSATFSIASATR